MGQSKEILVGEKRFTPRNGVDFTKLDIKDPKLKEWANADYSVIDYPSGHLKYNGGSSYQYDAGKTLRINDEPVMDTCERPWCEKTVRLMFEGIKGARTDLREKYEAPRILELGYGLGITSLEVLRGLDGGIVTPGPRGGEYTVVELNDKIAKFAQKTIGERIKSLRALEQGAESNIKANVVQGNAYDALEILAQEVKQKKRKPFDGIISDLYDPEQSDGTTDLKRMDLMRDVLANRGFFTFFVYHQESGGSGANRIQEQLLDAHGFTFQTDTVVISPNPNYEYLFQTNEKGAKTPVRRLTTITAWKE